MCGKEYIEHWVQKMIGECAKIYAQGVKDYVTTLRMKKNEMTENIPYMRILTLLDFKIEPPRVSNNCRSRSFSNNSAWIHLIGAW